MRSQVRRRCFARFPSRLVVCIRACAAALCVGLLPAAAAGDAAPEMLPADDPAWEDLVRLDCGGALPAGITSARPVTRAEAAGWVRLAAESGRADPTVLDRLRRSFARELRRAGFQTAYRETGALLRAASFHADSSGPLDGAVSELRIGPDVRVQLRGPLKRVEAGDSTRAGAYAVWLNEDWLAAQGDLFVADLEDGREFGDPLVKDTDILYFLDEASVALGGGSIRARLARGRHRWGPGEGSPLLLGSGSRPVNAAEWQADLPAGIRARAWTGSLNDYEQRGIAAHRLEIPLRRDLRIALAEGARFHGGIGHPLYLLGVIPYTLVQRLDWRDVETDSLKQEQRNNVLAEIEAIYAPAPGVRTWMELLIDDIPATSGSSPARLGARVGGAIVSRWRGRAVDASFEAMKVGRYTYAVYYGENWMHQGRAIGNASGPDVEGWRLDLGCFLTRDQRLEARFAWINDGAGALGEAWPERPSDRRAHPTREALTVSGPVTRTREAAIRWACDIRDNARVEASLGIRSVGGETEGTFGAQGAIRY